MTDLARLDEAVRHFRRLNPMRWPCACVGCETTIRVIYHQLTREGRFDAAEGPFVSMDPVRLKGFAFIPADWDGGMWALATDGRIYRIRETPDARLADAITVDDQGRISPPRSDYMRGQGRDIRADA